MRFLGLLSAIVFTALLGSLYVGSPVNAQSAYDNHIHIVEKLHITNATQEIEEDITYRWGGLLQDKCGVTLDFDLPYAVVQHNPTSSTHRYVIIWQPSPSQSWDFMWENLRVDTYYDTQLWRLSADDSEDDNIGCFEDAITTNPNAKAQISTIDNTRAIFIAPGWNPNYPAGYEGPEVPEVAPQPQDRTFGLSPFFNYQVDDMTVTLTQLTDPTLLDEYSIDECTFLVQSGIGVLGYYDYPFNCQSALPVFHDFTEYGQYEVKLNYYSSENDKIYETTQVLIIDGTTYTGRAGGQSQGNSIIGMLQDFTLPNHGLQQALVAPIQFVGSLPSLVDTCQPINLPLPAYVGSNDDIELPCLTPIYNSYAPQFLILWQVALTALVSYATVNKVFAKLRETYNPRTNSIEPTNL